MKQRNTSQKLENDMRIALSSPVQNSHRPRLSLNSALALWRSRRALASLSQEQLRDVGLCANEAHVEASRPIWDAPASWKC
ncbi:DUF1127 domain-containing protein [Sulfitobacter donghicola]|nr:DUF1127 domain-containing protein [Sulfitobacter donghicola]